MPRLYLAIIFCFISGLCQAAFNSATDLVSLHYDHAPDRDDGHAAVAGLIVTRHFGLNPHVIGGAYGVWNADRYVGASEGLMNTVWGGNWVNAHSNRASAIAQTISRWRPVLANGGDIWIAEGGQSDTTAAAAQQLQAEGYDTRNRIHLVQHSQWNEDHAERSALDWVKSNTHYIRIEDGNHPNSTADLNQYSSGFESNARSGAYSNEWNAAFNYLNPNEKLDFSDTVELLHILGVDTNQVATVDDFATMFMNGSSAPAAVAPATPAAPATPVAIANSGSGDAAFIAIRVEAESADSSSAGWTLTSNDVLPNIQPDPDPAHTGGAGGSSYLELLPDTRVTHGDPLLSGSNFWDTAGTGPSIDYFLDIPQTGRYLVYVRAYSTGSEDNGIHVGLNGSNPESGARIQWCNGKNTWTWSSAQRTSSNHCGVDRSIYLDITSSGLNRITFSAREDGFEFDQFLLLKETHGGSQTCYPQNENQVRCTDNSGTVVSDTFIPLSNADSTNAGSSDNADSGGSDAPANGSGNNSGSTQTGETPTCNSAASDPDGDGWGYENGQSCLVGASAPASDEGTSTPATDAGTTPAAGNGHPVCSDASSDPDGDGWGYENGQSCLVGANAADSGATVPAADDGNTSATGGSRPLCSHASSDPDGDGWGYENGQSCLVSNTSAGVSHDDAHGVPACNDSASDPDGDGWGWENNQSCLVSQ